MTRRRVGVFVVAMVSVAALAAALCWPVPRSAETRRYDFFQPSTQNILPPPAPRSGGEAASLTSAPDALTLGPVQKQAAPESQDPGATWARSEFPALTAFQKWARDYERAGAAEKRTLVAKGIRLARERRRLLKELMQRDPRGVIGFSVPWSIRASLPEEVAPYLEQPVAGKGNLVTVAGTPLERTGRKSTEKRVFLEDGRSFVASVYGRRVLQTTEYGVWLHGVAVDEVMAVDESPVRVLSPEEIAAEPAAPMCPACHGPPPESSIIAEAGGALYRLCDQLHLEAFVAGFIAAEDQPGPHVHYPNPQVAAAAPRLDPAWTLGTKRVLYLRVDFPDRLGVPIGQEEASNLLAGDVARFFEEGSYGRTRLDCRFPEAVYRMPQTAAWYATNNFYWQLFVDASAAAAAEGYNAEQYDRIFTVFNGLAGIPGSQFNRSGWAFVGGKHAWLNGYFTFNLTAHELGHTYGLLHANFWRTFDGTTIGPGTSEEYGDPMDVMGTATDGRGHFNPWFKHLLRWLDDDAVQTITASGTYRVYRHDHAEAAGIRGLKIPRGDGRNYWIGLRQLFSGATTPGANVLWGYNHNSVASDLLDMTPGGPGGQLESALPLNALFEDEEAGVSFRLVASGGVSPDEYLDIEVTMWAANLDEAVDAAGLTFTTGGASPWRKQSLVTHDASDAAESGVLGDTEESWMETSVAGPGTLSFWWQISAEAFDRLEFYTNGTFLTRIAAEVPWQQRTYHLGGGRHVLRWRYVKNAAGSAGHDRAWLDQLSYVPATCLPLTVEAEAAILAGPMTGASNAQASGGQYITSAADNAGTASWTIPVPAAGTYVVWCRVLAPDTGSDSFFVSVNGGAEDIYDVTRSPGNQWQWTRVNGRGGGAAWSIDPRLFQLAAGPNTLGVRSREGGARLDRLLVTCDTNFTPGDRPQIITQPASQDRAVGETAAFTVPATGFQPLAYQWRFNGQNLIDTGDVSGARSSDLVLRHLQSEQAGAYSVLVSNRFGAITSTLAVLTVATPTPQFGVYADLSFVANTNVKVSLRTLGYAVTGFTNLAGGFDTHQQIVIPSLLRDLTPELTAPVRSAISNFVFRGGKLIVHGSFYHYGVALLNAVFGMELAASRQSGDADLFRRMPGAAGTAFDGGPAAIPVNSGTTATFVSALPPNARSLYERNGQVAVALFEWGSGLIMFLGWDWYNAPPLGTADGGWVAILDRAAAQAAPLPSAGPIIVRQPVHDVAAPGESVAFRIRAEGALPIGYEWRKDGVTISHATNVSCVVGMVRPGDAGAYSVFVSNRFGTAVSSNAFLTVASTVRLTNAASIVIPEGGIALPYPTSISVTGLNGTLLGVRVTVVNFSHSYPDDVDMLLVGPAGDSALLMSDAGGSVPVSGLTLTFDDDTAETWIADDGPLPSGTYRGTEYVSDDLFPPPAPHGPYTAGLEVFNGRSPNGLWSLFVFDDAGGDAGSIVGGWRLQLWMRSDLVVSAAVSGTNIVLTWPATPNTAYRVLYRNSLSEPEWRPLGAPVFIHGGSASSEDTLQDQRFYRVEVLRN